MAKRVDANQSIIVDALRQAGCSVLDLHEVGLDCPDILVGVPWWSACRPSAAHGSVILPGGNLLLEIKTERGRLSPGQKEFHSTWPGPKAVVRSVEQALAEIGLHAAPIRRGERNWAQTVGR